jgi:hypothetical protein
MVQDVVRNKRFGEEAGQEGRGSVVPGPSMAEQVLEGFDLTQLQGNGRAQVNNPIAQRLRREQRYKEIQTGARIYDGVARAELFQKGLAVAEQLLAEVDSPKLLHQWATGVALLDDRLRLHEGEATSRTEIVHDPSAARARIMSRLAEVEEAMERNVVAAVAAVATTIDGTARETGSGSTLQAMGMSKADDQTEEFASDDAERPKLQLVANTNTNTNTNTTGNRPPFA